MNDRFGNTGFKSADIWAAFSLLTRIPIPVDHDEAGARGAIATWAYPVVGAALGAVAAFIGATAAAFGAPAGIVAALALATLVVLTGAMHEDGLSDCADGLGGGLDKAKRLEIMKDSRIGAFGATALGIALIARWSGIEALVDNGTLFRALIAVGAISRVPMVVAMFLMPNAKDDGLAAGVGLPPHTSVVAALVIGFVICMIATGWSGIFVFFWALVAATPLLVFARRLIGGVTGDILGGTQQLAEIAALAAVVAALT